MTDQTPPEPRKSLFRLIADVPKLLSDLVRSEIEQLKAEIASKLKSAAVGIGLLVGAATIAGVALLAIVTASILALAQVLPAWAAALIVAGILLLVALVLALVGVQQLKRGTPPMPTRTIDSIKKDVNAIKGIGKRD
jgi:Putative Actinobacterial Holin-X, holin superfamily III